MKSQRIVDDEDELKDDCCDSDRSDPLSHDDDGHIVEADPVSRDAGDVVICDALSGLAKGRKGYVRICDRSPEEAAAERARKRANYEAAKARKIVDDEGRQRGYYKRNREQNMEQIAAASVDEGSVELDSPFTMNQRMQAQRLADRRTTARKPPKQVRSQGRQRRSAMTLAQAEKSRAIYKRIAELRALCEPSARTEPA
jgi:hypothetical protein